MGPFSVSKHPRVSDLIAGIINTRMPPPRYCFIWDVEKVINFLDNLNSESLELKF